MNKVEPLMYVLYSLLIGILLYVVFRFIMGYNDHLAHMFNINSFYMYCIFHCILRN